jgi:hypothetical protein
MKPPSRGGLCIAVLLGALSLSPGPCRAACRLALALGFDVSNSVDPYEYTVQRDGLIAALEAPEIRRAFLAPEDKVVLSVFEWGGRRYQTMVVDWIEVRGEADLDAVIAALQVHNPPSRWEPTAIGAALTFAHYLFEEAPVCTATTLDLSGDGRNNDWLTPGRVYEREDFGTLLVNGLAIGGHETDIAAYYRQQVIRGPGAFVEIAPTHLDFPRAIRRKLERELTGPMFGALLSPREEG